MYSVLLHLALLLVIYFFLLNSNFYLADINHSAFALSETFRLCHTYKREHRLGQIYHNYYYLMLFVSNTCVLSNRSSHPKVFYTKGTPQNFAKPTGKHLLQNLPFNKEKTTAHAVSHDFRETLKTIPLHRAPPGAASTVTYTLKLITTCHKRAPGFERKIIIYLIIWIYVAFIFFVYYSHYIYT